MNPAPHLDDLAAFEERMAQRMVPLPRHAAIVRSIYAENQRNDFLLRVIIGHQHQDGHRYEGERCVWCGINYYDHLIHANDGEGCTIDTEDGVCNERCSGPAEGEWNEGWWPLAKVDALLAEHRGYP